jgi:hypothetical protein
MTVHGDRGLEGNAPEVPCGALLRSGPAIDVAPTASQARSITGDIAPAGPGLRSTFTGVR